MPDKFFCCFEIVSNLSPGRSELAGTICANQKKELARKDGRFDMDLDMKQKVSFAGIKSRLSGLLPKNSGKGKRKGKRW